VEESLAAEHGGELLTNTLEHLLDGGGVSEEADSHLQTLGRQQCFTIDEMMEKVEYFFLLNMEIKGVFF
jgi:hypothetical protein